VRWFVLLLLLLFCQSLYSQLFHKKKKWKSLKCYSFKEKKKPTQITLNIGLRVNNFIYFDINLNPSKSKRSLFYKPYFDVTNKTQKLKLFYRIRPSDNTFVNYPKEHLLLFFKNFGHIQGEGRDNAYRDMVGRVPNIPEKVNHIPYAITTIFELFAIGTNHNFSRRFPYYDKKKSNIKIVW